MWVSALAGAGCWGIVYWLLPTPWLVYVLGHEATHALWTWICGGRVRGIRVTSKGGQIEVTKNNWLITLAPYFFPLYGVIVLAVFGIGHGLWDWSRFVMWLHFLLGAAYAFHVTLTLRVLQMPQSDIKRQGWLFSAVVIWLGNVGVLLVGLPGLTGQAGVFTVLGWCVSETFEFLQTLRGLA
jgi:hypothetical protein